MMGKASLIFAMGARDWKKKSSETQTLLMYSGHLAALLESYYFYSLRHYCSQYKLPLSE